MSLGRILKNLRKSKGLTQERVSKELEVSIQSVNNWENDKTLPDLDNLVKLSRYYDVDIIGLLIENEKCKFEEVDNLINQERFIKGEDVMNKSLFSLFFNVLVVVASLVLVCIFIFRGLDFYLCLIPLSVLFCGGVSLYMDLKKRKKE
ncbi:helix-turn-helix domain-containing protein [Staphylococcus coagulans]|uniref:helix-turn-helix domain-containing protein n=1 Tax=Staphylococcus coagulans TaxID=74706 RepID=UPI0030EB872A